MKVLQERVPSFLFYAEQTHAYKQVRGLLDFALARVLELDDDDDEEEEEEEEAEPTGLRPIRSQRRFKTLGLYSHDSASESESEESELSLESESDESELELDSEEATPGRLNARVQIHRRKRPYIQIHPSLSYPWQTNMCK